MISSGSGLSIYDRRRDKNRRRVIKGACTSDNCNITYGLGSGCHAEPKVGEIIRSKHKVRIKLVKIEDRSNECEHPVSLNHQETE